MTDKCLQFTDMMTNLSEASQALARYEFLHWKNILLMYHLFKLGLRHRKLFGNLITYLITFDHVNGKKFVVRKQPDGNITRKNAHRLEREYKIMKALQYIDMPISEV